MATLQVTLVQKGVEDVDIQQKTSTLRIMQVNMTDLNFELAEKDVKT